MTGIRYRCPRCGQRIVVYITPTHPPTCSKHTGGGTAMQQEDKR